MQKTITEIKNSHSWIRRLNIAKISIPLYAMHRLMQFLSKISTFSCRNRKFHPRRSHRGAVVMNPTSIHEDGDLFPGLIQSGIAFSCSAGRKQGSDLVLLWLWCRPAATAPIRPLAWELPCATSTALRKERERETKRKANKANCREHSSSWGLGFLFLLL